MFISKKKFQEEIAKAQKEALEEIFEKQALEENERRLLGNMDCLRKEFYRQKEITEKRLDALEKAVFQNTITGVVDNGKSKFE